ncbi:hypothetical protein [Denitrobaculum tricleocarpae]|uniref:Uncharacterized protein n=1 Tax=Denitrobaculum tricleocarpae TaxID=2591009 RepID=A0A545TG26_9PROT|nr:hypothetical protein [Denitrobaculum tricleocarpae]TQV76180.1 hypothetical protein FKG95_21300 [Denitrobaculum tricleocarpae]
MHLSATKTSSISFFAWTGRLIEGTDRLIEGLREEFHAIHIQDQDRAFLATGKGMTYAPLDDAYYADNPTFSSSTTH